MRTQVLILSMLCMFSGCSESKPDPRDHPNFVDTSDPSNLRMPGGTPPTKSPEKEVEEK